MSKRESGASLTREEIKSVLGLSVIFGLRLLGLFLLLPVLSPYARGLAGATPFLAGLAVGAYGLSQMVLQIPVGLMSDRWGRIKVLVVGQLVYALGAALAARTHSIHTLLAARMIQGAGAIASVVVAMIADVTRDEVRTQAMMFVGISVGLSFMAGFLFGPLIAARWGVPMIFWALAVLDVIGAIYLWTCLEEPKHHVRSDLSVAHLRTALTDRNLLNLDLLNFCLHCGLTATFVVTPFALRERFGAAGTGKVYGPMILIGALMMGPLRMAEKRKRLRELLISGLAVSTAGYLILSMYPKGTAWLVAGIIVFFAGFNLQEPTLPSLVTRFAPSSLRGSAVGAFSMAQFFGSFCGGALGGWFLGHGPSDLFVVLPFLAATAAIACLALDDPRFIRQLHLSIDAEVLEARKALRGLPLYDVRPLPSGALEVKYSDRKTAAGEIHKALEAHGIAWREAA